MNPLVKTLDLPKEPTRSQLDHRLLNVFSKDHRLDDGMLRQRHRWSSVLSEMGQGELMGSICCTRIPFILVAINQSYLSPLLKSYSANPLIDPKTHIGTGTVELFFVMILTTPYAHKSCSMFSLSFGHDHVLSHFHFTIMMILLTVSPTLVPLLTHSLLLSIFS